jgi:anti-sigma factor RsiW
VNRETRRVSTSQMLAYVDDCLPRSDRAAFEDNVAEDPKIGDLIDLWLLQNEAIRAAFPDASSRRASAADSGFAARSVAFDAAAQDLEAAPKDRELGRRPNALIRASVRLPQPDATPLPPAQRAKPARTALAIAQRYFCIVVGALAFWAAGDVFQGDDSADVARAATAAYRAFVGNATRPVEIATSDPSALDRWFAPQIPLARPIPDLAASGLILLGGRIVPGAFSPAQYLLYENAQHERLALEIETIDAPPESPVEIHEAGNVVCASWTGTGRSFVLVGRASRAKLGEWARDVRESSSGN